MRNRSLVSEREFTRLDVDRSVDPSLGRKLLFVFPLTNAQLHLTKRKMSSNGSANVKYSEAMSDEIVTAMSTACGASIFLFELFLQLLLAAFLLCQDHTSHHHIDLDRCTCICAQVHQLEVLYFFVSLLCVYSRLFL